MHLLLWPMDLWFLAYNCTTSVLWLLLMHDEVAANTFCTSRSSVRHIREEVQTPWESVHDVQKSLESAHDADK